MAVAEGAAFAVLAAEATGMPVNHTDEKEARAKPVTGPHFGAACTGRRAAPDLRIDR